MVPILNGAEGKKSAAESLACRWYHELFPSKEGELFFRYTAACRGRRPCAMTWNFASRRKANVEREIWENEQKVRTGRGSAYLLPPNN